MVERLGGGTTVFDDTPTAFGQIFRGHTFDEVQRFQAGDLTFEQEWTPELGLGPDFVATTCQGCHINHGRSTGPRISTTGVSRVAPALIGLGLLEFIPDARLDELADPDDLDGDGISGTRGPGRFGWTAAEPTVASQTAAALANDFGVTLDEIDEDVFDDLVFYTAMLAVPAQRDVDDPDVQAGAALFHSLGCTSCHVPNHTTPVVEVAAMSNQEIWPYTDLLLHDLGEGEYRTPPLWGLGLNTLVSGDVTLWHDGAAEDYDTAIVFHGGEASQVRAAYEALPDTEQRQLFAFLDSL